MPGLRRLFLVVILGACGRRTAQGPVYAATSADPLGDHLGRIRAQLEPRGYHVVGTPQRGDLAADGMLAIQGEMPANGCTAFIALGGNGIEDLDLFLFDSSLRQIGRDTRRDPHPWIVQCSPTAQRVVARVRAYRGAGPYLFAVLTGPLGLGDLSGVVSSGLLTDPPPAVDPQSAERIAAFDVEQGRSNGVRAGSPITLRMTRREIRPIPLVTTPGGCYAIASFGGEGIRDTDLFLLAPNGSRIQLDDRRDRDAAVRFCADVAGAYQLQVKANRGDGLVYLVPYGRDATALLGAPGDVAPAAGATGPAVPASPADEGFRSLDSDVRARGYEPIAEPVVGDVANGGNPIVFDLPMEAERCYAVAAATAPGGEIEVHLKTRGGQSIEAEVSAGAATIVRACADGSGPHRIEVGLRRGGGPVMARAYLWPRATRGPFGLAGVPFVRLAEATSLLAMQQYEPLGAPESSDLRQGASSTYPLALEAPVCHAVVGVGGLGVDEVNVEVVAGGRTVSSDTSDGPIAIAQVCPPLAPGAEVRVRAERGAGRVLFQLFEGPEQATSPTP